MHLTESAAHSPLPHDVLLTLQQLVPSFGQREPQQVSAPPFHGVLRIRIGLAHADPLYAIPRAGLDEDAILRRLEIIAELRILRKLGQTGSIDDAVAFLVPSILVKVSDREYGENKISVFAMQHG